MAQEKGEGQGKGKFTKKGVQADQEARIAGIEDYLANLIDLGTLPPPEVETEPPTEEGTPPNEPVPPATT